MRRVFSVTFATAALSASLLASSPSVAATQIFDTPSSTPANQGFAGTLGLNFTVNVPVTVSALGSFDSGKNGIGANIWVGLYDLATGQLVAPAINLFGTANPGGAAYVTKAVTPVTLAAGTYQLAAWGYDTGPDYNYNNGSNASLVSFDTLGGALTPLGSFYGNSATPGSLATNAESSSVRYGAGTFVAELARISPVPEPGTWAMMLGGFVIVGASARRRRQSLRTVLA